MARLIEIEGIRIFAQAVPCAHSCRYCLIGRKKTAPVAFHRFAQVVERFIDWRARTRNSQFGILAGFEDSYEFDVDILEGLFKLYTKIGWDDECKGIKLGGLKWRPDDEMRGWLAERQKAAGLKMVHASLAGMGSIHDHWNGRRGDFDFLFRTMVTAADLGLGLHQRLFVVRSTYPSLSALLDCLDAIPGGALRYLSTFIYRGSATRLEDERITEDMRDRLPTDVSVLKLRDGDVWRSEREWIAAFGTGTDADKADRHFLDLEINSDNIDWMESRGCEEMVAELCNRTREAYACLPSGAELCERYGDPTNQRIYASFDELERKWLDQHVALKPIQFDRHLTHLSNGH